MAIDAHARLTTTSAGPGQNIEPDRASAFSRRTGGDPCWLTQCPAHFIMQWLEAACGRPRFVLSFDCFSTFAARRGISHGRQYEGVHRR